MILKAFSIHDVRADLFNTPFFARTTGEAIRSFTELANDSQSLVSKYPADYRLVEVGAFSDEAGHLQELKHQVLGFASDFIRPVKGLEVVNG